MGGTLGGGSIRGGPFGPGRLSNVGSSTGGRSDVTRSDSLSALGPVGGARVPDGAPLLGTTGKEGAVVTGDAVAAGAGAGAGAGAEEMAEGGATTWGTGVAGAGLLAWTGLGGGAAVLGFTSSVGFLQTLDPKAGTAAGGDEARGAYLSLDASARLANRRSSLPGSRRESLAADGSVATEERRGYESSWGPSRSAGDG